MERLIIDRSKPTQENFLGTNAFYHGYAGLPDHAGRVYSDELCELEADIIQKLGVKVVRTYYKWWAWSREKGWNWENETKLIGGSGDINNIFNSLKEALEKGEVEYDTQRILSFINRIIRLDGGDELLARYNRDNSRFDVAFDNRKQMESVRGIYQNSQEKVDGKGLSLRDKSSLQKNDESLIMSDRDEVDVYELMGENKRLVKENEAFKADVDRLRERLKIERQVTHGNYFNENQLNAVAGHLRKIANTTYDKVELMKQLKDAGLL